MNFNPCFLIKEKHYFRDIDALRFLAFALIFITHTFISSDPKVLASGAYTLVTEYSHLGLVALDCFFVLSSFLITWIILEEQKASGAFKMGNYLIRRCLRIWPLYFLTVFLGWTVALCLGNFHGLPPWYHFVFFTLNFYIAEHGPYFFFFLVFLWSIAAEEQFYILWAVCLKFFKHYFSEICVSLILLSLFFRGINYSNNDRMFFSTFNICGDFAIGALVARMAFEKRKLFTKLVSLPRSTIILFYIFLLLNLVLYRMLYFNFVSVLFERLIFSLLFAFVILEQNFSEHSFFKVGNSKVLTYLGKISYGLYIYHGIVITFFSKLAGRWGWDSSSFSVFVINPILIFGLTVLISVLSYEVMEKRILKLKQRFYA